MAASFFDAYLQIGGPGACAAFRGFLVATADSRLQHKKKTIMGRIKKEDHDGFTGDLGPVTVTRWKETVVVKARQRGPGRGKSAAQQAASRRFGLLTRFATVSKAYLRVGFGGSAKKNAQHAFIAANMKDGVAGMWPELAIDYGRLVMSEGDMGAPRGMRARAEKGRMELVWDAEGGEEGWMMVMVYNEEREESIVEERAGRSCEGRCAVLLPEIWGGDEGRSKVHVYACQVTTEAVGGSVHLGPVEVTFAEREGDGYEGEVYGVNKKRRRERKRKMGDDWEPSEEDKRHVMEARGKIGPVLMYDSQGRHCMRQRYRVRKAPTEAKARANERFRRLTQMLRQLNDFLREGFAEEMGRMTPLNAGIKYNYGRAYSGDGTTPEYGEMVLSAGPLEGAAGLSATREGRWLTIGWAVGGGDADDELMVAVYDETLCEGRSYLSAGRRGAGTARVALPWEGEAGGALHVYVAFVGSDGGGVSGSSYCRVGGE